MPPICRVHGNLVERLTRMVLTRASLRVRSNDQLNRRAAPAAGQVEATNRRVRLNAGLGRILDVLRGCSLAKESCHEDAAMATNSDCIHQHTCSEPKAE